MITRFLFVPVFTALSFFAQAQNFNSPESVEYDPAGRRYIVSNTNGGNLLSLVPGANPTLFTDDVTAPYGLAEYNGVVYVCDDGGIKGFSLANGQRIFTLNLGGSFLNGICSDGNGRLFVTDFSGKKIFAVNIATQTFATVVANTVHTPNGILFDMQRARLYFCTWGGSAKLVEVDTVNYSPVVKITTSLTNFDGVVRDGCGNFFVSEWGSDKIYKIDSAFGTPVSVFSAGIGNPADIYFNPLNDTLAVPNTSLNTVTFYKADFCEEDTVIDNTSIVEPSAPLMDVVSLPGELRLLWSFPGANENLQLQVTDMAGRLICSEKIAGAVLKENTHRISTQNWPAGIYLLRLSSVTRAVSRKVYVGRS